MSVQSEITRLQTAKADMMSAILDKGGTVIPTDKLESYAASIRGIPTGADKGAYVWAVYDGDINAYAGQTVTTATNASGWYQTQMQSSLSVVKVVNGRFHFSSYLYVTSTDSTTTTTIGTWISRDGTMCFVGGSSSNNTLYTFTASLLHYAVADSASAYASGLHSDGTYYKPLFGGSSGSMNAFALDTSSFAGTSAYNVNITGLTGDYGFNGVSVAIPKRVHTATYSVTTSSPSATGSMEITGIGFTPTSFLATIVGTGSTNSVCSVAAINTSTATYTRTTSGVATSSAGTKSVTYGNGTLTIPQYNSSYNFKVGTWRIVCWR